MKLWYPLVMFFLVVSPAIAQEAESTTEETVNQCDVGPPALVSYLANLTNIDDAKRAEADALIQAAIALCAEGNEADGIGELTSAAFLLDLEIGREVH